MRVASLTMYKYARAAADDQASEPVFSACIAKTHTQNVVLLVLIQCTEIGSRAQALYLLSMCRVSRIQQAGGPAWWCSHLHVQIEDKHKCKDGHALIVK